MGRRQLASKSKASARPRRRRTAVERARRRAGLTVEDLAARTGLSLKVVRCACDGIATMRTLMTWARVLELDGRTRRST